LYAATFEVADLSVAEAYLSSKDVGFAARDETTPSSDPTTDCVVMGFTTGAFGYSRPDWCLGAAWWSWP
jgi:hypothetical protein